MALLLTICFLAKSAFALDIFTSFSRKELEPILSKYKDQPLRLTYGWPELLRSNIEVRKPKSAIVWLRRRQDFEIFRHTSLLQKISTSEFPEVPGPFRDDEALGIFIHPYVMVHAGKAGKAGNWRSWSKAKFKGKLCGDGDLAAEILAIPPIDKPHFLKIWRYQQPVAATPLTPDKCLVTVNSTAHFASGQLPQKFTVQDGGRLPFSLSAVGLIGEAADAKKFVTWLISQQQKIASHFHAVATNPDIAPPSSVAKLLPKDSMLGTLYAAPF
jgi:hypothetical protein